ncbi:glycosyltransferase WbuB [Vibrio anguillarum]|uniref:glycosyltransferase family 4 protein n=1 Tax=Vibrio TaxID=662 RepID=UPI000B7BB924|nr:MULTISPECIES: glycosyltransferase family 4 protein [Vibrio]ASO27834.1 glycosyltransferase WbuB [Vibrio anguillarum]NAW98852.1 glycosyltransferase [Vibrio sp. V23_P3S9T160]OXX42441.1 glycosyltransferase WbuB [Vibrio sp. V11_P1A41T118]
MKDNHKKIWYISKYANISKYGADTRQSYFCKEFSKKGNDVTLILSNSSHLYSALPKFRGFFKEENYSGFNVVWVNTLKYKNSNSPYRILSWFHFEIMTFIYGIKKCREKPDVVIASSLSILSVISGVLLKRFYGCKFIFEVRDIWPQSLVELKGLNLTHPLVCFLSWIEKLGYKSSDIIVGTMGRLNLHVRKQIQEDKQVICIPHGVSLDFYEKEQTEINPGYIKSYFSADKPNLVYAGSFNQAYKLSRILSLAGNAKKNLDVHFVLIGDGPELEKLQNMSRGMDNVTIAPKVSREALHSILKHADLLLHSFDEKPVFMYGVSPNKFVDYMYAGKPTICIGNVFCPMLEESGAGVVIAPYDESIFYEKVREYLSLTDREKELFGLRSRQYIVEELNYSKLAEKYCALFDN